MQFRFGRRGQRRRRRNGRRARRHSFRRLLLETLESRWMWAIDVASPLSDLQVGEDAEPTILDLRDVFRADNREPLAFEVLANTNPALVQTSLQEWTLKLDYALDQSGTSQITVRATGLASGETAVDTLNLTVSPTNDFPITSGIPTIHLQEDAPDYLFDLKPYFVDKETGSADLTYTLQRIDNGPDGRQPVRSARVDPHGVLLIQLGRDQFGYARYQVQATDEAGGTIATTMHIVVGPVDDPPSASPLPDRRFATLLPPKVVVDLRSYFFDPEGGDFDFSIQTSDSSIFSVHPFVDGYDFLVYQTSGDAGLSGSATIEIRATDSNGGVARLPDGSQPAFEVTVENPAPEEEIQEEPHSDACDLAAASGDGSSSASGAAPDAGSGSSSIAAAGAGSASGGISGSASGSGSDSGSGGGSGSGSGSASGVASGSGGSGESGSSSGSQSGSGSGGSGGESNSGSGSASGSASGSEGSSESGSGSGSASGSASGSGGSSESGSSSGSASGSGSGGSSESNSGSGSASGSASGSGWISGSGSASGSGSGNGSSSGGVGSGSGGGSGSASGSTSASGVGSGSGSGSATATASSSCWVPPQVEPTYRVNLQLGVPEHYEESPGVMVEHQTERSGNVAIHQQWDDAEGYSFASLHEGQVTFQIPAHVTLLVPPEAIHGFGIDYQSRGSSYGPGGYAVGWGGRRWLEARAGTSYYVGGGFAYAFGGGFGGGDFAGGYNTGLQVRVRGEQLGSGAVEVSFEAPAEEDSSGDSWADDPGGGSGTTTQTATDKVNVHVVAADLDIDSDNTNHLGAPDGSAWEEQLEDDTRHTGKRVLINAYDDDHDAIADYFDGFNLDSLDADPANDRPADNVGGGGGFVPLTVRLPQGADPSRARIWFAYSASNPGHASLDEFGGRTLPAGGLRIWTRNEAAVRDPHQVNDPADPGHFVASNRSSFWWGSQQDAGYAAAQLTGGAPSSTFTLYVEGVRPGKYLVNLFVDPDGRGIPEQVTDDEGHPMKDQDGNPLFQWIDMFPGLMQDTVRLTVHSQVALSATDAVAAEGGQISDDGAFTITRGEGNTEGSLPVYYRLIFDPASPPALDAMLSPASHDFTADLDGGEYGYAGAGSLIKDPFTLIGETIIPAGQSSVTITVNPTDDRRVEWDEFVQLELLSWEELQALRASAQPVDPGVNPYVAGLPGTVWAIPVAGGNHSPYYSFASDSGGVPLNRASLGILDNDDLDGAVTRNLDTESTGQRRETVSNGVIDVGLHDGQVTLLLPLGEAIPSYRSNDSLRPIIDVELKLPYSQSYRPTSLRGRLTFAGLPGPETAFDVSDLDAYLSPNPARPLRLLVMAPPDLSESLASGNYEYDVEVQAVVGGDLFARTLRASTQVVNHVSRHLGSPEFGERWWLDGLHRLAPGDGITPPANALTIGSSPAASRLAPRGAATSSGVALLRGDNTSAWYKAHPHTSGATRIEAGAATGDGVTFSDPAAWSRAGTGGYGASSGGYRFSPAGLAGRDEWARWAFGDVEAGQLYQVFASWTPGPDRAGQVPYTIEGAQVAGGGLTQKTILVDQRFTPGEFFYAGRPWRSLGYYVAGSDELAVQLNTGLAGSGYADGLVVAGAVMLVKDWNFQTPPGSYNFLAYGALDSWEGGGYHVEPSYTSDPGNFTLLTKQGGFYAFDSHGRMVGHADRNRNRVALDYTDADADGLEDELEAVMVQGGLVTSYSYSGGYLEKVTDFAGRETSFTQSGGRVTEVRQPDPGYADQSAPLTTFAYDGPGGLLSEVTDAEGFTSGILYTAFGVTVHNPDSSIWLIAPTLADGLSGGVRAPGSGYIGNMAALLDLPLRQSQAQFQDGRGNVWTYQTDDYGLPVARANPEPFGDVWHRVRNASGQTVTLVEPAGSGGGPVPLEQLTTRFTYDGRGNLTGILHPDGNAESWQYDSTFSQLTGYTDPRGLATTFALDPHGNAWQQTRQNNSGPGQTTSFQYTPPASSILDVPGGLVTTAVYGVGSPSEMRDTTEYYLAGHRIGLPKRKVSAAGSYAAGAVEFDYDDNRNRSAVQDPRGAITLYVYDDLDRPREVVQPPTFDHPASVTVYDVDGVGNVRSVTDPRGAATQLAFDGLRRLTGVLQPDGGGFAQTFDAAGNVAAHTDALGRVAQFEYDNRNLLTATSDPLGQTTYFTYDSLGNQTGRTDPRGVTTQKIFDARKRPTELIEALATPLQRTTSYVYDSVGNILERVDPAGRVTRASHDAWNRVTSVTNAAGYTTRMAYDSNGNLVERTDAGGRTTTYVYDAAQRPTSMTNPEGYTIYWGYDAAGNLLAEWDSLQRSTSYFYDAQSRLQTIVDPLGGVQQMAYDPGGNLVARRDPLGRTTAYTYDAVSRLVSEINPLGGVQTNYYDAVGNLAAHRDELGRLTGYTYDALDRLAAVADPAGNVQGLLYDAAGNLMQRADPLGRITSYTVDALNRRVAETDPLGRARQYTYNDVDLLVAETDELGRVTRYAYDAVGNRTTVIDPAGGIRTFTYDSLGNLLGEVDQLGRAKAYSYDLLGRRTSELDPSGGQTLYAYDLAGNLVAETDPLGRTTSYAYDALGRRVQSIDALGGISSYAYDLAGNLLQQMDPLARLTQFSYDALGREIARLDPLGGLTTSAYDAVGNVVARVDSRMQVTTYAYDESNRPIARIDPLGSAWLTAYDALGNVIGETDPLGYQTSYVYDDAGRLIAQVDAEGGVATFVYDAADNLITEVDPLGRSTAHDYDVLDRRIQTVDALGGIAQFAYDTVGNLVAETDARGRITQHQYDASDRRTQTLDALGGVWQYGYDGVGNLRFEVDPLGRTTERTYDALNRLQQAIDPAGGVVDLAYDQVGNLRFETDPLSRVTEHQYDGLNRRLVTIDSAGGSTFYAYDSAGNLTAVTDAEGRVTQHSYEALGRRLQTLDAEGGLTEFAYDAVGNLVAETDALGRTTLYAYDGLRRSISVTDPLWGIATTTYDRAGNVTRVTDRLGLATAYTYDPLNRRISETDALGGVTSTIYDAVGNVLSVSDPLGRTHHYWYDALDRQVQSVDPLGGVTRTTYDAMGNRMSVVDPMDRAMSFHYDELNREIEAVDPLGGTTQTQYDAAGNVLAIVDPLSRVTRYQYDSLDRLIRQIDPDPDGPAGPGVSPVNVYNYDRVGNLLARIDPLGRSTSYAYDGLNRQTAVVDAAGNETTTDYDAVGNITRLTDALGRQTHYTYDGLNRLITETDPLGGVTTRAYDAAGNLVSVQDALGRSTTFGHDALHRQTAETDPLGGVTQTAYDAVGNVLEVRDALGRVTRYVYDALDRQIQVVDPLGGTTDTAYDAVGNTLSTIDPLGRTTSYVYDERDRRTGVTDAASGTTLFAYDLAGNVLSVTDALGHVTQFRYDDLDRQTEIVDALEGSTQLEYDAAGSVLGVTDPLGRATSFVYDELARQIQTIDALGGVTETTYDPVGNVLARTDALGRTTSYSYDALNRQTHMLDALGGVTARVYDAVGNLVSVADPLGRVTGYEHDELNQRIRRTDPDADGPHAGDPAPVTQWSYDAVGNMIRVTDPLGRATISVYDDLDRRTQTVDALGNTTETVYDTVGNVLSITDPLGRQTVFVYDDLNRATHAIEPLGNTTMTAYDAVGNVTSVTDPLGHTIGYRYDELNRRVEVTDPLGGATQYFYDAVGNRTTLTDPAGNTTSWDYDELNRVVAETNELGVARRFVHDAVGNLVARTDRNGRTIEYAYDALNRRLQERWLGTDSQIVKTLDFTYDAAGQLLGVADDAASVDHAYDALGRMMSAMQSIAGLGFDVVLEQQFDLAGNRLQLAVAADGAADFVNRYTYDDLSRMTRIEQLALDSSGWPSKSVELVYDAAGQLVELSRLADPGATSPLLRGQYTFDGGGRLTELTYQDGSGAPLAGYAWTYDAAGRVTQFDSLADGTARYAYDASNQLIEASYDYQDDEAHAYDANGNRQGAGYVTGPNNRTEADSRYVFEYDGEGNRTRRTDLVTGKVTDYGWDHRNRLVSVVDRETLAGPATQIVEYAYDATNRRIARSLDTPASGLPPTASYYIYDGLRESRDGAGDHIALVFADGDVSDSVPAAPAHRLLHGPAVDQILADEQFAPANSDSAAEGAGASTSSATDPLGGSRVLWPLADNLGTIRDLVERDVESGAARIASHLVYDAFGNVVSEADAAVVHLFGFTGRERDLETGLQFHRARYYDSALGQWLSEDPLGFAAGDANLRRYLMNDPLGGVDASGLEIRDGKFRWLDGRNAARSKVGTWLESEGSTTPIEVNEFRNSGYFKLHKPVRVGSPGNERAFEGFHMRDGVVDLDHAVPKVPVGNEMKRLEVDITITKAPGDRDDFGDAEKAAEKVFGREFRNKLEAHWGAAEFSWHHDPRNVELIVEDGTVTGARVRMQLVPRDLHRMATYHAGGNAIANDVLGKSITEVQTYGIHTITNINSSGRHSDTPEAAEWLSRNRARDLLRRQLVSADRQFRLDAAQLRTLQAKLESHQNAALHKQEQVFREALEEMLPPALRGRLALALGGITGAAGALAFAADALALDGIIDPARKMFDALKAGDFDTAEAYALGDSGYAGEPQGRNEHSIAFVLATANGTSKVTLHGPWLRGYPTIRERAIEAWREREWLLKGQSDTPLHVQLEGQRRSTEVSQSEVELAELRLRLVGLNERLVELDRDLDVLTGEVARFTRQVEVADRRLVEALKLRNRLETNVEESRQTIRDYDLMVADELTRWRAGNLDIRNNIAGWLNRIPYKLMHGNEKHIRAIGMRIFHSSPATYSGNLLRMRIRLSQIAAERRTPLEERLAQQRAALSRFDAESPIHDLRREHITAQDLLEEKTAARDRMVMEQTLLVAEENRLSRQISQMSQRAEDH